MYAEEDGSLQKAQYHHNPKVAWVESARVGSLLKWEKHGSGVGHQLESWVHYTLTV